MSTAFQLFVDKENAVAHPTAKGTSINAKDVKGGRRVLGDKNNLQSAPTAFAGKPVPNETCKLELPTKKVPDSGLFCMQSDFKQGLSASATGDDEKENMHVYPPEEDDYDDIWPKAERPSMILSSECRLPPMCLDSVSVSSCEVARDPLLYLIPLPQAEDQDNTTDIILESEPSWGFLQPVGEPCIDDLLPDVPQE